MITSTGKKKKSMKQLNQWNQWWNSYRKSFGREDEAFLGKKDFKNLISTGSSEEELSEESEEEQSDEQ